MSGVMLPWEALAHRAPVVDVAAVARSGRARSRGWRCRLPRPDARQAASGESLLEREASIDGCGMAMGIWVCGWRVPFRAFLFPSFISERKSKQEP